MHRLIACSTTRLIAHLLAALAVALACTPLSAQDYPTKPIRIIVPFAAGGPADVYARFIGARLQDALGQPVVVDDRPGAGSIIGTDAVAKSAPDGYTLLMMSNTQTVNETLIPNKPYALMRDFTPVAPVNYSDLVLVVHPSVGANSVADLIRIAKASPGKLNYASSGPGTPYHMAGELFKAMAGVDIVHVPYKGSSGARTDILGGQVQMMFDAVPTMSEHAKTGRVKALGTTGKARSTVLPNLPTISEAGVQGYEAVIWLGLMAPKGTPPAIVNRLNAEITKIQNRAEVRQEWEGQGALPMPMTPDEFSRYLNDDIVKWERIVKISGAKADQVTAPEGGARLHLLSAGAAQGIVGSVADEFGAATGAVVHGTFGAVGAMRDRLLAGEPCDALILTAALIATLETAGHVVPETAAPLGRVRTGIAVRAGEGLPSIADGAALRKTLLDAAGLYFPDPELATAGIHFVKVLRELGIHDAVASRLHPFPNGATAMRELARAKEPGRVGCTQITEIKNTPGVILAGPLPTEFELSTVYSVAVSATARDPDLARRFVSILSGSASRALRVTAGFE